MDIPGLSVDGHTYSGVRGYSDMGGGRVDIPGLSVDGQSYSGIQGYSDMGGRVDIPGLSVDGHSYYLLTFGLFVPSKVLGNSKVTVSSMDDSGLSTAPSDNPQAS